MTERASEASVRAERLGNLGWTIAAAFSIIALDQLAKWLILRYLVQAGDGRVTFGVPWLGFTYVENRGAAFGMFQGHSWVFLCLALIMVGGIALYAIRERARPWLWQGSLGLILGGAVGNIIDRLRLGYVIDFVAIGPWPKFNIADAAITVGIVLFAILIFRDDRPSQSLAITPLERTRG